MMHQVIVFDATLKDRLMVSLVSWKRQIAKHIPLIFTEPEWTGAPRVALSLLDNSLIVSFIFQSQSELKGSLPPQRL